MKITVTFESEPGDTAYHNLDGMSLSTTDVRHITVGTPIDFTEPSPGFRELMDTGCLTLHACGHRAMWRPGTGPQPLAGAPATP